MKVQIHHIFMNFIQWYTFLAEIFDNRCVHFVHFEKYSTIGSEPTKIPSCDGINNESMNWYNWRSVVMTIIKINTFYIRDNNILMVPA